MKQATRPAALVNHTWSASATGEALVASPRRAVFTDSFQRRTVELQKRSADERVGLTFEGRAHNGLVDSRNTAALALRMARGTYEHGAFVFRRPTRGLDADGDTFRACEECDDADAAYILLPS